MRARSATTPASIPIPLPKPSISATASPRSWFHATYDEGLGTVVASTDFNTNTTTYGYDIFGRLLHHRETTATRLLSHRRIRLRFWPCPSGSNGLVNYVETRQLDNRRQSRRRNQRCISYLAPVRGWPGPQSDDQAGSRAGIAGGAARESWSTVPSSSTPARSRARPLIPSSRTRRRFLDDLLAFENIEAPGWQGPFQVDGNLVSLDLRQRPQDQPSPTTPPCGPSRARIRTAPFAARFTSRCSPAPSTKMKRTQPRLTSTLPWSITTTAWAAHPGGRDRHAQRRRHPTAATLEDLDHALRIRPERPAHPHHRLPEQRQVVRPTTASSGRPS